MAIKKIAIHHFAILRKIIIDAVASLNQPVANGLSMFAWLPANTMGPKVEKAHKNIFDIARAFVFWAWFSGLICTWLASWLFWSGYVKVAGEL